MKSKTILGADGATKMQQITVGIHGKGGEAGIKAIQLALLKGCDFVIVGVKYGITEGMDREIHTANMLGITVIDANQIKQHLEYEEKRQERAASDYAKLHSCEFCSGSKLYSCTGYDCRDPYRRAYEHALSRIRERQET